MADDSERIKPTKAEEPVSEMPEAEIDNNLVETFPASDPPSWTLGTDHKEKPSTTKVRKDKAGST